jgi:hypothetical protein
MWSSDVILNKQRTSLANKSSEGTVMTNVEKPFKAPIEGGVVAEHTPPHSDIVLGQGQAALIGVMANGLAEIQRTSTSPTDLEQAAEHVRVYGDLMIDDVQWDKFFNGPAGELLDGLDAQRIRFFERTSKLSNPSKASALRAYERATIRGLVEANIVPEVLSEADRRRVLIDILNANKTTRERQLDAMITDYAKHLEETYPDQPEIAKSYRAHFANRHPAPELNPTGELATIVADEDTTASQDKQTWRTTVVDKFRLGAGSVIKVLMGPTAPLRKEPIESTS